MALTVIPAPDMSGQTAGWEMLARAAQEQTKRKQERESNYQKLIISLSDPNTTEDQQNALLSQDPKQFQEFYGVPIAQVGKDVAAFRTQAGVTTPEGTTAAGPVGPTGKRVLVPHPGGTPAEQKAAAELELTKANTTQSLASAGASTANANEATARTATIAPESQAKIAGAVTDAKANLRTAAGKVPTFNEVQQYFAGNLDLTPTTAMQKKIESYREIYGVDPNTPEGRLIVHDLNQSLGKDQGELDKIAAETRNANADAALREQELSLLQQGINPKTGKALDPGADPKDIIAGGKAFTEAFAAATGVLGFPVQATTNHAGIVGFFTRKATDDNAALLPAIFGTGVADPASVRRDLLATIPAGRELKTINFPAFDAKTNQPTTKPLTVDQAVPVVTQMRRTLATTLPPVFAAMRQMSPQSLLYMMSGNPLIEQAAKAYAPDLAQRLADARKAGGASATQGDANAPPPDENVAPLMDGVRGLQSEMDGIRKMLQGKAGVASPPAPTGMARTDAQR